MGLDLTMASYSPKSRFSLLSHNELETVLNWRNKPHIRQNMHHQDTITWTQHSQWYEALTNDDSRLFFVFYQNDRPIGVLNFSQYPSVPDTFEWGCYIGEDNAWPGSGLLLEIAALQFALEIESANALYAEVLSFNKSVIKLHTLFQYMPLEDGPSFVRDEEEHCVKRFKYKREQWQHNKAIVLNRLPKQICAAARNIEFEV